MVDIYKIEEKKKNHVNGHNTSFSVISERNKKKREIIKEDFSFFLFFIFKIRKPEKFNFVCLFIFCYSFPFLFFFFCLLVISENIGREKW